MRAETINIPLNYNWYKAALVGVEGPCAVLPTCLIWYFKAPLVLLLANFLEIF
jgi:hypothetical protein